MTSRYLLIGLFKQQSNDEKFIIEVCFAHRIVTACFLGGVDFPQFSTAKACGPTYYVKIKTIWNSLPADLSEDGDFNNMFYLVLNAD